LRNAGEQWNNASKAFYLKVSTEQMESLPYFGAGTVLWTGFEGQCQDTDTLP